MDFSVVINLIGFYVKNAIVLGIPSLYSRTYIHNTFTKLPMIEVNLKTFLKCMLHIFY